jgi:hypothetical protein
VEGTAMRASYDGKKLMLMFPETDSNLGEQTLEFLIGVYEEYEVDATPVREILNEMRRKVTFQ